MTSGKPEIDLSGHAMLFGHLLTFTTRHRYFCTWGRDTIVRVWDPRDGAEVAFFGFIHCTGEPPCLDCARNGRMACAANTTIHIWEIPCGHEHETISTDSRIKSIKLTDDGTLVAASYVQLSCLHVYDIQNKELKFKFEQLDYFVNQMKWCSLGKTLGCFHQGGGTSLHDTVENKSKKIKANDNESPSWLRVNPLLDPKKVSYAEADINRVVIHGMDFRLGKSKHVYSVQAPNGLIAIARENQSVFFVEAMV